MKMPPEISVIIPIYKVEKYIRTCIDSVLNQSFQDFEIILVDDESPDDCPEICDDYAKKDDRIRVIHKDNEGLGFARNSGLDVAMGRYVCFLDSDDYLAVNTFEYCHRVAIKEDADQVRYMFNRFVDADAVEWKPIDINKGYIVGVGREGLEPILNVVSPLLTDRKLIVPTTASSCTALYRRSLIEKYSIRFFSERELISEDYLFNIDFGVRCDKIIYTSNKFYNYRHNLSSLTYVPRIDRFDRAVRFVKFLAERMKSYGYDDADTYVMGYAIGEMRSSNLRAFESNLPYREKREIFLRPLELDYIKKIQQEYPMHRLSAMQRIAFSLHVGKCYWLSYFLTKARSWFKE